MAANEALLERFRTALTNVPKVTETGMFCGITLIMVDGKKFRQCERRIEAQKRQQTRGISKFVSRPSNLCAPRLPLQAPPTGSS